MILALSLVGLIFLGAAYLYFNMHQKEKLVAPVVDQFFSRYNANEYSGIYQDATANFRKTAPEAVWETYLKGVRESLGIYESRSLQHAFVTDDDILGFAEVEYNARFSEGTIPITFLLFKEETNWAVSAVYFSSGKVKTSLSCPHCGEMVRYFRSECPKCSKKWYSP